MKNLFIIAALLFASTAYSQGFSNEKNVKVEDYELSPIPSPVGLLKANARIRKTISSKDTSLLYQIRIYHMSNTSISDININDVLYSSLTKQDIEEAREALTVLLEQSKVDVESKANYIENEYLFENGFSIGYFISKKGNTTWYFTQDNGIREVTFWVKNINEIVKSFSEAKVIIEQLEKE